MHTMDYRAKKQLEIVFLGIKYVRISLVPMSQNVSDSFFYSLLCVMSVRVDIHHMVVSGRAGVVATIATVEKCLQEMCLRPHRLTAIVCCKT